MFSNISLTVPQEIRSTGTELIIPNYLHISTPFCQSINCTHI
jgi:hypothetical protein